MKRFVEFSAHEYMDMHPSYTTQVIEGENEDEIKANALEWAKQMTRNYSGGPTSFEKIMTKQEAAEMLANEYKMCLLDSKWPDDDNIEEALKVTSEKNIRFFFDCYGRNANK